MSKSFINLSNDFENLNEEYQTSIHIVGDGGKVISFEASGETPEELYSNLLLNGMKTIMDSKISEEDNDLDDDAPEDNIDTDELLLQHTLELEEENEMLRDEINYTRKLLKQIQDSFTKQEDLIEESFKYIDELEEENKNLYKVVLALQNEKKITPNKFKTILSNNWPIWV